MSLTGEKLEEQLRGNSSDSEENFETVDEGDSDESVSQSVKKLKGICIRKNLKHFSKRRIYGENPGGRLNVSLRQSKNSRQYTAKCKFGKHIKRKANKKCIGKGQDCLEDNVEVPQKGKRCRVGGKAKGKPPEEENCDKFDSDEDTDNFYFSRISLGYFQKYRDESGASTSYQRDESYISPNALVPKTEELTDKMSEELELLELQQWGMSNIVSFNKRTEKLSRTDDVHPDTF